jgi:hypothetical protein
MKRIYGPRALVKHKHPDDWPSGIMPPPLLVSRASKSCTTSSISGRLSGFASQHLRITFTNALGQQRGMSGRKFCQQMYEIIIIINVGALYGTERKKMSATGVCTGKKNRSVYKTQGKPGEQPQMRHQQN